MSYLKFQQHQEPHPCLSGHVTRRRAPLWSLTQKPPRTIPPGLPYQRNCASFREWDQRWGFIDCVKPTKNLIKLCLLHVGVVCSAQEEVLVEDSAEAEGVVPTDNDGTEASQVGKHPTSTIYFK